MIGIKRKKSVGSRTGRLEPWVDWQVRSLRVAMQAIDQREINIMRKLDDLKHYWVAHICRMGMKDKEPHLVKTVLTWRCQSWWSYQKLLNDCKMEQIKHPAGLGLPLRFEDQFVSDWLLEFSKENSWIIRPRSNNIVFSDWSKKQMQEAVQREDDNG